MDGGQTINKVAQTASSAMPEGTCGTCGSNHKDIFHLEERIKKLQKENETLKGKLAEWEETILQFKSPQRNKEKTIQDLEAKLESLQTQYFSENDTLKKRRTGGRGFIGKSPLSSTPKTPDFRTLSKFLAAAMNGEVEDLRRLLDAKSETSALRLPLELAILEATKNGHAEAVNFLLENGAFVHAIDPFDFSTPLHHASSKGYKDIVRLLLAHGAKAHLSDEDGNIPLTLAMSNRHGEIIEVLLQHEPLSENEVMLLLTKANSLGMVQEIEKAIPGTLRDFGEIVTQNAAAKGRLANMVALLDGGVNVNATCVLGITPLMYACLYGQVECVEELLKREALTDLVDIKRWTALHYAAYKASERAVQLLLLAGADPTLRNIYGTAPLDLAKDEAIKQMLKSENK